MTINKSKNTIASCANILCLISQAWFADDIEDYHDCADPLLLMGDFNTPNVDWKDFTSCSDSWSSIAHDFINATLDSYLTQHIFKPTQYVPGQKSSVHDLIFTSNLNSVDKIQHCSLLGFSDHECLLFEVKFLWSNASQAML